MSTQEARNDEREAQTRYPEDHKTIGGNASQRRAFLAGVEYARKQAEPELEYGVTHVDPARPVTITATLEDAQRARVFYSRLIAGWEQERGQKYPASRVYRRTKAVEAGPWVSVEEETR